MSSENYEVCKVDDLKKKCKKKGIKGYSNKNKKELIQLLKDDDNKKLNSYDEDKKEITKRDRRKYYSYMENTETDIRLQDEHNMFIEKWKNAKLGPVEPSKFCNNKESFQLKDRKFELIDNKIVCTEICLLCKERNPITSLYFHKTSNSNNLECESGKEMICNSLTHPCIACWKKNALIEAIQETSL